MDESLIKLLADNPDDLSTFGVVADKLIAAGDPRGELMQLQLKLEDEGLALKQRNELVKREGELLKEHGEALIGPLAEPLITGAREQNTWDFVRYRFSRGLLHTVEASELDAALLMGLRESDETRFIERLVLNDSEYIEEELTIDGDELGEDDSLMAYLPFAKLGRLRELSLGATGDDDNTHAQCEGIADRLAGCAGLESLELGLLHVETASIFKLQLPKLRRLVLFHVYHYDLETLAANASMNNLEELRCRPHGLEPGDEDPYIRLAGLRALVASPHMQKLRVLELRASDIGDAGVKLLLESGWIGRLESLDLHYGEITDEGARMLAEHPDTKKLRKLDIGGNALTEAGLTALKEAGVAFVSTEQFTLSDEREYLWYGCPE